MNYFDILPKELLWLILTKSKKECLKLDNFKPLISKLLCGDFDPIDIFKCNEQPTKRRLGWMYYIIPNRCYYVQSTMWDLVSGLAVIVLYHDCKGETDDVEHITILCKGVIGFTLVTFNISGWDSFTLVEHTGPYSWKGLWENMKDNKEILRKCGYID